MTVLDLRAARRLFYGATEAKALYLGATKLWEKPPQISDFYGLGAGQVPGDWRVDQAWLDDTVTRVRNDGGAGAGFALSGNAPISGLYVETGGATIRALNIASSVNLVGVHFLTVLDFTTSGGTILSRNGTTEYYWAVTNSSITVRNAGVTTTIGTFIKPPRPAVYEMRWDGAVASSYLDGHLLESVPLVYATWAVNAVGRGRTDRPVSAFSGRIGRCVSVILDPSHNPSNVEPAVMAARQQLAAQYGIPLA